MAKEVLSALFLHNGDAVEEMYHNILVKIPDEEENHFIKNAMLYANHKVKLPSAIVGSKYFGNPPLDCARNPQIGMAASPQTNDLD